MTLWSLAVLVIGGPMYAYKRLHPFEKASTYPALEPLIVERVNVLQIESQ